MFDITSSKLLILAIVALIVVGPKDLPVLLRTVGKYLSIVRRHAADFRAQLDEVMREAELDDIKKEFDNFGRDMHASIEEGGCTCTTARMSAQVNTNSSFSRSGDCTRATKSWTVCGSAMSRLKAMLLIKRCQRTSHATVSVSSAESPRRGPSFSATFSPSSEWSPPRPLAMSCRRVAR